MQPTDHLPTPTNPGERLNIISNRWRRIRALFIQRWWILLLTVSAGVCYQAWQTSRVPDEFVSRAQLVVAGSISLKEAVTYREDVHSFFGTQKQILQSGELHSRVKDRIRLLHPELAESQVSLVVERERNSAVFNISTKGPEGPYVHAYLDSLVEEYINFRKEMRSRASDNTLDAITKELTKHEEQVETNQQNLTDFLEENNIVVLQEGENNAAAFLASLNQERARLQTEYNLLKRLDIEQDIDRRNRPNPTGLPEGDEEEDQLDATLRLAESERDYLRTKQEIQLLRAERERRSKVLKEKHPTMRQLAQKIDKAQTLLAIHRTQSEELNAGRVKALELAIGNLDSEIESWESKTIETNQKLAQYSLHKSQLDHSQKLHQDLLLSLHQVDQTRNIAQDSISVMEQASAANLVARNRIKPLVAGALAGLLIGSLLLFALDRLDDRMHSTGDYIANFTQPLLAVVPDQTKTGLHLLIAEGDTRHMFVEAYRQLRSSILFKEWQSDEPPKVILITSGIPFEGKSTTASNLAISLALGKAKTLIIDADMRRGALGDWFGVGGDVGFSDAVAGDAQIEDVIAATSYPNLSLIPRGEADIKDFDTNSTRKILEKLREDFEFISIDSAPLLVVDDTASLAPIVDTTLTVMRLNKTPARVGQQTLDRLIERQADGGGVILNCDEPRYSSYKSYGYYRYYDSVEVHAKKRAEESVK